MRAQSSAVIQNDNANTTRSIRVYKAIWRWYPGLCETVFFSILWLSIKGLIDLRWMNHDHKQLSIVGLHLDKYKNDSSLSCQSSLCWLAFSDCIIKLLRASKFKLHRSTFCILVTRGIWRGLFITCAQWHWVPVLWHLTLGAGMQKQL